MDTPPEIPERTREHHWLVRLVWAIPLILGTLALVLEPDPRGHGTHEQLGLPACRARDWLGVPCPGCGVTTAVVHLGQGHPLRSFVTQPFGFLVGAGAMLLFLWVLWTHHRGRDAWLILVTRVPDRWVRVVMMAALFGWIWRIIVERR